jgi:hypothetical protein
LAISKGTGQFSRAKSRSKPIAAASPSAAMCDGRDDHRRQQRGLPETEAIAMRGIVPALGVLFALAVACPDAHAEERPPVHAGQGSIAIGGSVSNSTIGVPYEKLEEAVRSRTKDLEDLTASEKEIVVLLKEKLVF